MDEYVDSPLGAFKARLCDEIVVAPLVERYSAKLNVDVGQYFGDRRRIGIYECEKTKYRFYYPFDLAGDGAFYEALNAQHSYHSEWKVEFQFAKDLARTIGRDAKILDVGCGYAAFLSALKLAGHSDIHGLEFNQRAVEIGLSKGMSVSGEAIADHAQRNSERYDLVTCFQVLEHISNPRSFLESIVAVTKKGGKIVIAVPNNEPFFAGLHVNALTNLPPHHMGLWSIESLRNLERIFSIKLLRHQYDQVVSWPYYLLFLARYPFVGFSLAEVPRKMRGSFANFVRTVKAPKRTLNRVIIVEFEKM